MKKILILIALGGLLIFYVANRSSGDDVPVVPAPLPAPKVQQRTKKTKAGSSTLTTAQKLAESKKKLIETAVKALRTNVVKYKRKSGNDFSADTRALWLLSNSIKNKSTLNEVKKQYFNTYQSNLMDDLRRPLTMNVYNKYQNLK